MKKFKVTIYSPADGREDVHIAESFENLDKVFWVLSSAMEVGAWFKIERTE